VGSLRLDTLSRVETPEGITLTLRCAGLVARTYAFGIDLLIRFMVLIVAGMLLGRIDGFGAGLFLVLAFALEWLYPVAFELTARAATPGKRAMNLAVVMDDGMPVTPSASLLRNLLRTVDFLPFGYAFGFVALLLRHDFKRLGDIAAGTLVVHTGTQALHGEPAAAEPQPPARALTPGQQTAIVDWALRTPRLTPARAEELAAIAAPALRPGAGSDGARLLRLAWWARGRR
jgi:uncharacterized RDD family membrane protein YckC